MKHYLLIAALACAGSTPALAQTSASPSSPPMQGAGALDDRGELVSGEARVQASGATDIRQVQQQLIQRGYPLTVDGQMGPQTRAALQSFQQSQGFNASGSLDQQTLGALGIGAQGSGSIGARPDTSTGGNPSTANPSGIGSNPSSVGNPSGVGSNPSSIGNPSGVGSNPNTGTGTGSNTGGAARGGASTGTGGAAGGAVGAGGR